MSPDINLLPEKIFKEKVKTRAIFAGNAVSFFLLIALGVAVFLSFHFRLRFSKELGFINQQVAEIESKISENKPLEGKYRTLKIKIQGLENHFSSVYPYSAFLDDLTTTLKGGIKIKNLEVSEKKKVDASGVAPNIPDLANFLVDFSKKEGFSNIKLVSAGKDYKTGEVSFTIEFETVAVNGKW